MAVVYTGWIPDIYLLHTHYAPGTCLTCAVYLMVCIRYLPSTYLKLWYIPDTHYLLHGGYLTGTWVLAAFFESCVPDINECLLYPSLCEAPAECVNTPGMYECRCPPGFKYNFTSRSCDGETLKTLFTVESKITWWGLKLILLCSRGTTIYCK